LAIAAWPAATLSAAVPGVLVDSTARAATLVAAGGGATSAKVAALTQGVLRTMFLSQVKVIAAMLLVASLLLGGVLIPGALPQATVAQQPAVKQDEKPPDKKEARKAPDAAKGGATVVKAGDIVTGGTRVESVAYCNGGKTVAVLIWREHPKGGDHQPSSLVLWDLQKRKVEHVLQKFDEGKFWSHMTASKDGTMIAAVSCASPQQATIQVWEAKTGNLVQTIENEGMSVTRIAFSPDGKNLVGSGLLNHAFIWNVESGKLVKKLDTKEATLWSVASSPDGQFAAAAGQDREVEGQGKLVVWNVKTGKARYEFSDSDMHMLSALAISPDGKMLAAGESDFDTIRLWDLDSAKLKYKLKAHGVAELAFSPDGKALASAGRDGKVIVWDVAKEKPRLVLKGHSKHANGNFLRCIAFAPDGRTVASGSWDGTMRFWPVAPAEQPKK
jgi:WD40 repeat protein